MDTPVDPAIKPNPELTDSLSLLDHIPDAILIADPGGLIVYSNPLLDKVFGYDSKELVGKSVESLIPERYQAQHIKHRHHFFSSPITQAMSFNDLSGLHKNGEELRIEVNLSPYPLGDAIFSMAVIRDVSEHYWEQQHLKEREERLRVLLESTRAIPWAADPVSWNFTYVGPQAVKILGYPVERWYEKDFWVSRIHPEDRENTIQFCAESSTKLSNYEFEYRMIKSDGGVIWFHDIVNVEFKNAAPHILRGFLIDITDRKLAEQKLQEEKQFSDNIIDSLPGLFFMLDRQGRYIRWNKNAEEFSGCSGEQLAGRKATDFISEEQHDEINQAIETCFREGCVYIEYDHIDKDGNRVHYAAYAARAKIAGDDYMVGLELDMTKQKKLEQDLRQLSNDLAHINRVAAMGELTASMAHEINQPLAAIMSNAQAAQHFLEREIPDIEEVKAALTDIISDDKRAGDVINKLRKLLIKAEPENEILDLVSLIQEVIKFVKNEGQNKGVVIIFEEYEVLLPQIEGDRVQLQQVVLNLILNAFDAMVEIEKKKRTLEIKAFQDAERNLIVQFIDNGIGFGEQNISRLFDAFYTSKQSGMGMGLAISRSIIGTHGGELWASQNEKGGATFYFTLPVYSEGGI